MKIHPALALLVANFVVIFSFVFLGVIGGCLIRQIPVSEDLFIKLPKFVYWYFLLSIRPALLLNIAIGVPTIFYCRYHKITEKKKYEEVTTVCFVAWCIANAFMRGMEDLNFYKGLDALGNVFSGCVIPTMLAMNIYWYLSVRNGTSKKGLQALFIYFVLWCVMCLGFGALIGLISKYV